MNPQVVAYCILFFAIFVSGFCAGDIAGDDFREVFWWIWDFFKKHKLSFLTRKYWYNRKLQKNGIEKQVLCLLNSYSTDPSAPLVTAGVVYNVLAERDVSNINWGDKRGAYILKEHGWNTEHSKTIFIDYYGEPIHKLLDKHHNRIVQLRHWLNQALENHQRANEAARLEQLNNFKLLR
jgi:hypothetical protein